MESERYLIGNKKYDRRFIYWKSEYKGVTYFNRTTRYWWKPFKWIGEIKWFRYGRLHWWIRRNLTFD